jgi:hypothetical protein
VAKKEHDRDHRLNSTLQPPSPHPMKKTYSISGIVRSRPLDRWSGVHIPVLMLVPPHLALP